MQSSPSNYNQMETRDHPARETTLKGEGKSQVGESFMQETSSAQLVTQKKQENQAVSSKHLAKILEQMEKRNDKATSYNPDRCPPDLAVAERHYVSSCVTPASQQSREIEN